MEIRRDEATGQQARARIRMPMDGHQHLRNDAMLRLVVPMVAKRFSKAIVMPNLAPPITTEVAVVKYRERILAACGDAARGFLPLMTMYLTDTLEPYEVRSCLSQKLIYGIKYYPPGLTTNSNLGVASPTALWTKDTKPYQCLRELTDYDAVLLLHAADGVARMAWGSDGRSYRAGDELDPYDQEKHFIQNTLPFICEAHPNLKVSVEHLSTGWGAECLRSFGGSKLGCSLTAQHLLLNRLDSFKKDKQMGFNPHRFWWPIIQPKEHQKELRKFASEGRSFVWLGSDSAPHPVGKKETDCCTGGVLMAHAGIELYVEAFEDMGCLEKLEEFASINGPRFYGLEPSDRYIELVHEEWKVEKPFFTSFSVSGLGMTTEDVIPFRLGETIRWKLVA